VQFGLQTFDANGNIMLDTTSIVGILIGKVTVAENQMTGIITDAKLAHGKPFAVPFIAFTTTALGVGNGRGTLITSSQPVFTFGHDTITWVRPAKTSQELTAPPGVIYYGVYSGV